MQPVGPTAASPRRRGLWIAVGVVVVAAVVVGALFATGTVRLGSSSSPPPADETFSQAVGVAGSRSGSVGGGPWYAFAGVALLTPVAILEPATNLSALLTAANCTARWIGPEPTNVAVPATGPTAALGASAYWTFLLKNASNGILLETVADGMATAVVTLGGTNCTALASVFNSFGSGMQDSPKILGAANAAGGTSFLAEYPNATQAWVVSGGATVSVITTSPEWLIEYTSCALPLVTSASGAVFNATVGGTSATVTNHASGTVDCALTAATGPSLLGPGPGPAPALEKLFK